MKTIRAILAGLFLFWCTASAPAMLMLNELNGFNVGGSAPPVLTRTGGTTCTNNASSYGVTCTGGNMTINTGTAAGDRYTCIAIGAGTTSVADITGVTIDGNAMTKIDTENSADAPSGIFCLTNTSGTSSAFVVTFDVSITRVAVEVYSITGLSSTTPTDFAGTDVSAGTAAATLGGGLDLLAGGVAISVAARDGGSGTVTWSGTAGLVEDSDQVVESNATISTAILNNATAITAGTVVATFSYTSGTASITGASWR